MGKYLLLELAFGGLFAYVMIRALEYRTARLIEKANKERQDKQVERGGKDGDSR